LPGALLAFGLRGVRLVLLSEVFNADLIAEGKALPFRVLPKELQADIKML
jgi:hypothetical protein